MRNSVVGAAEAGRGMAVGDTAPVLDVAVARWDGGRGALLLTTLAVWGVGRRCGLKTALGMVNCYDSYAFILAHMRMGRS